MIYVGVAAALLAPLLPIAQAAVSVTAVCTYAEWTFFQGQTPCQIWGNLQGKCDPNASVPKLDTSLNDDAQYPAPNGTAATPCECNTVAYNLMAACSWCQPDVFSWNWMSESQWRAGCSSYDSSGQLPSVASSLSSSVPPWAHLQNNPSSSSWSPSEAQDLADPGNTGPSGATGGFTSSHPFSTGSFGGDDDPFDDDFNSDVADVGRAAGIAIGVVLGIWLIIFGAGLAVFCVRKKNREAWYGPTAEYYRNGGRMQEITPLFSGPSPFLTPSPSAPAGSFPSSTPPLHGDGGFTQQAQPVQYVAQQPGQFVPSPGQPQYDTSLLYTPGGTQPANTRGIV